MLLGPITTSMAWYLERRNIGSESFTGGVITAPRGQSQSDFILDGVRYRPTIKRPPSEANLRRARERLKAIKQQIRLGGTLSARLCSDVFDSYLEYCEARRRRKDMAAATVRSYRKVLDCIGWRPYLGRLVFSQIRYSRLIAIADGPNWSR